MRTSSNKPHLRKSGNIQEPNEHSGEKERTIINDMVPKTLMSPTKIKNMKHKEKKKMS